MTCPRTVSLNFPCNMTYGHEGPCQADISEQLRIYGVTLEEARELARNVADAKRYGLIGTHGRLNALGRYIRLRAGLERHLEAREGRPRYSLRVEEIRDVIAESDAYTIRAEGTGQDLNPDVVSGP